ncbi:MAG: hypothetical protein LBO66_06365 [Deltaproteobacteria bacterium]|nr:hypothetical protein [Deltaproteobacteria bacterium]
MTDVVGSRSITIQVTVNGVPATTTFVFGDGPLSVFSGVTSGNVRWATSSGDTAFMNLNGNSGPDFPAAVGTCGGSVANDAITGTNTGGQGNFTYSSGWENGGTWGGYSTNYASTSKLPKVAQALAVAKYNGSHKSGVQRKGAAYAAGWGSVLASTWVWTGEVDFSGGSFDAWYVDLVDGNVDELYVSLSDPVAVCLRP